MNKCNKLLLTVCPLCESDHFHYAFVVRDNPICQCGDCGHMFLNPQPSDDALKTIYSSGYFQEQDSHVPAEIKCETAKIYLQQLIDYYGQNKGNLLEIGCGNGDFLLAAQESGFNVAGIEISPFATEQANSKLAGNYVKCGTLEDFEFPSGYFDVCALFNTLEHATQPIKFLTLISRMLKPGGALLLIVPSLDNRSTKTMKDNWMGFKAECLHYFDPRTIQNALAKSGFEQVLVLQGKGLGVPVMTRQVRYGVLADSISILCRSVPLKEKKLVSIIVPVYNERETFPVLMESLLRKEIKNAEKEIVIVESNSTDGTRDEVLRYEHVPGVKIVFEDAPKGKGHAVRTGFEHISGDFVMIQDGDLEYDINDYDQLLEPLIKYQQAFVLGSRHNDGWKMRKFDGQLALSTIMNFGHIFFTALLNLFCGQRLKDPFTMYKVFRRDCLYGLDFRANRFDFDWEIVIKLLRKGYRPLEIPVNYKSRSFKEGKKVSFIKDPLSWMWALVKFRFSPLYTKQPYHNINYDLPVFEQVVNGISSHIHQDSKSACRNEVEESVSL